MLLQAQKKTPKVFDLLIGSYTDGGSDGIYVYRFYTETGKTAYLNKTSADIVNPSYLCISADRKFVYAVNEDYKARKGAVSAFSFDYKYGKLDLLNQQASADGPCYISIDKDSKHVFAANYNSGSLYVFPVNPDGSLGAAVQTIQDQGSGPDKSRQDKPHVHTAVLSPDEKYLMYSDLGTDKLNIYRYKSSEKTPLTPADPSFVSVRPGDGPRHIDFTPDHKRMYLITEMGGNIYGYDYKGGKLKLFQTISVLPDGYKGAIGAADIHVSPDGRFLYATNRGDANEIVVFSVNPETGLLTFVERQSSRGITPRNFVIDPTGNFLLVANQKSKSIIVYRIDPATGKLKLTLNKIEIDSPSCLKFVSVD
jgi:6-phosphogluconolactonase